MAAWWGSGPTAPPYSDHLPAPPRKSPTAVGDLGGHLRIALRLRGCPHDAARCFLASPELERERALLDKHRQAVEDRQAPRLGGAEEGRLPVGEVVDERVIGEAGQEGRVERGGVAGPPAGGDRVDEE